MKGFIHASAFGILFVTVIGAQPVAAETFEVMATGSLTFDPPDIKINAGDSVHWSGLQDGFHTVAEVSDESATMWTDGFHSDSGASEFTHIFNTAGDFFYICEPHVLAGMRGTVTVNPVPTVSEWGLVALALSILTVGTLIFRRLTITPAT